MFRGDADDKILCYNDGTKKWYFTDEVCSRDSVISSTSTADVVSVLGWWYDHDGDSTYQSADVLVVDASHLSQSQCGDRASSQSFPLLPFDDPQADMAAANNDTEAEVICMVIGYHGMVTDTSLWDGGRTFTTYNALEVNDQPIYHHVVYNESRIAEVEGVELGPEVEAIFYVHYQPEYLLVTDTEMTGQWMLTKNEISVNYVAKCIKEDLLNCTGNDWKIKMVEFGDDGFDGIVTDVFVEFMTVWKGECPEPEGEREGDDDQDDEDEDEVTVLSDSDSSTLMTVIVVIVVVIVVSGIASLFARFLWRRKETKRAALITEDKPLVALEAEEESLDAAHAELALTEVGRGGVGVVH